MRPKLLPVPRNCGALSARRPQPARIQPDAQAVLSPDAQAVFALVLRIQELEVAAADLQGQMIASSGLIKALAEQNTQLILRIETLRIRMGWLAAALAMTGLVATVSMILILIR